jgi:hypothetical protein
MFSRSYKPSVEFFRVFARYRLPPLGAVGDDQKPQSAAAAAATRWRFDMDDGDELVGPVCLSSPPPLASSFFSLGACRRFCCLCGPGLQLCCTGKWGVQVLTFVFIFSAATLCSLSLHSRPLKNQWWVKCPVAGATGSVNRPDAGADADATAKPEGRVGCSPTSDEYLIVKGEGYNVQVQRLRVSEVIAMLVEPVV